MSKSLKIYISHVREDLQQAKELHAKLAEKGYLPWLDEFEILPGDPISRTYEAIENADVVIMLVSLNSVFFDNSQEPERILVTLEFDTTLEKSNQATRIIPALLEDIDIPEELKHIHPVRLYEPDGFNRLLKALQKLTTKSIARSFAAPQPSPGNLIVTQLDLRNIRCFEELSLSFEADAPAPWTTILGDNATGKSTVLRSIALGLCNESDTVALMKEVPGSFLSTGATEGTIVLTLMDTTSNESFTVTTTLELTPDSSDEVVRKQTSPKEHFPWSDIFVCGYGTQRSAPAHAGHDRYSARAALGTLFDDTATLQNPELVLLRQQPKVRAKMERRLLDVLMLDDTTNELSYEESGASVRGPWGEQSFTSMSDGYRSTSQWVLDFMAWLIQAGRLNGSAEAGGILILDEVEQHLHPRWQRYIVQRLHQQFPNTQIIASTHTPLVAAGAVDIEGSRLVRLIQDADGKIGSQYTHAQQLAGLRADQILASNAFGLATSRSPGSTDTLRRYAELKHQPSMSDSEENELRELKTELEQGLQPGENDYERKAQIVVDLALKKLLADEDPELVDLEVRRRLQEVFGPDGDS